MKQFVSIQVARTIARYSIAILPLRDIVGSLQIRGSHCQSEILVLLLGSFRSENKITVSMLHQIYVRFFRATCIATNLRRRLNVME